MTEDKRPHLTELYATLATAQPAAAAGRLQLIEDKSSLQLPPGEAWLRVLGFETDPLADSFLILDTPAGVSLGYQSSTGMFFIADIHDLAAPLYRTRLAALRLLRGLGVDFHLYGDLTI